MTPESLSSLAGVVGSNLLAHSANWLAAVVVSLLGSAFATGRAALGAIPLTRLTVLLEEVDGKNREAMVRYASDPVLVQSRWLVARVTCTALTAVLIALALSGVSPTWTAVIAVFGTVVTYGVFTEVGTTMARRNPDRALPIMLRMLRPFELLFAPVAMPLAKLARLVARLAPDAAPVDGRTTEHEVELLVQEGAKAGTLGEERAEMIQNVLELNDLTAVEVMVPRTKITAIPAGTHVRDVLARVAESGHSRYPVYRESIDNIVGLLVAKDLYRVIEEPSARLEPVEKFMRTPVNFVPETQQVSELLREMRARRLHLAVVVDDYGGVSGIVTLEDIIEEIIGDIQDEHDAEEDQIVELGDGRVLVDAATPIYELSRFLGVDIPEDGDIVSVGGLVVSRAGEVPERGAEVDACGLRFIVRDANERMVSKVEVIRMTGAAAEEGAATGSPESGETAT